MNEKMNNLNKMLKVTKLYKTSKSIHLDYGGQFDKESFTSLPELRLIKVQIILANC